MGIVLGYVTYLSFKLADEHKVFKILLLIMSILFAFMLTGYVATSNQYCEVTLDNVTQTNLGASNFSDYQYQLTCFDAVSSMPQTLFKIMTWIVILFFAYVIAYLMIQAVNWLKKAVSK